MTINTRSFGEISIAPEQVIRMEAGLLGYEDLTEFVLVSNTDTEGKVPFWWLQSCHDPNFALVVTVPFLIRPEYEVDIPEDIVRVLDIRNEQDVAIFSVCTIPERFEELTVNLMSPLIVNARNNRGMQIVMHQSSYAVNEPAKKK